MMAARATWKRVGTRAMAAGTGMACAAWQLQRPRSLADAREPQDSGLLGSLRVKVAEVKSAVAKQALGAADGAPQGEGDTAAARGDPQNEESLFEGLRSGWSKAQDVLRSVQEVGFDAQRARDLVDELVTASDSERSEHALGELLKRSQEVAHDSSFQPTEDLKSVVELFHGQSQRVQETLNKTFGHVAVSDLNPHALYYYVEREDEVKNPSWKRRKHRFCWGADVEQVEAMRAALTLADVSYLATPEEVARALPKEWAMFHCQLDSIPGEPAHYLALKEKGVRANEPLTLLCVIRGTAAVADVFTDALMDSVPYEGGLAHSGIIESGRALLERHAPVLEELKRTSPGGKVRVELVGHSLGAGVATIYGMELKKAGYTDVRVTGFGCPSMLSKDLSESCKDYVTTVVADGDMIPRCNAATLANLVADLTEFDWRGMAARDTDTTLDQLYSYVPNRLRRGVLGSSEDFKKEARDRLSAYYADTIRPKTTNRAVPELFPPGQCVHVYRDGVATSCCLVPCDFFNEIDVSRTMLTDHLIVGYDRVILELLRNFYADPYYTPGRVKAPLQ